MSKPAYLALQNSNSLATGLIRCFAISEGQGSTLTDYSSTAANLTTRTSGTAAAATWGTDSTQGPFISLDGSTQDAVGADSGLPAGTTDRTFAFLFRTPASAASASHFFASYGNASGNQLIGYGLVGSNGSQSLFSTTLAHGSSDGPTQNVDDGNWHLGVISYSAGIFTFYLDGTKLGTSNFSNYNGNDYTPNTVLSGTFTLGEIPSVGLYFQKDLAGVWGWSRTLSSSDVANFQSDPWQMVRGSPPPTVSGVTVTPTNPAVPTGTTQTFTAAVSGTNNPGQGVTWTTTLGTITAAGILTPPPATSSVQTGTVTATSTVDSSHSGMTTFSVPAVVPTLTLSPSTTAVTTGTPVSFVATLSNTTGTLTGSVSPTTATLSTTSPTSGTAFTLTPTATGTFILTITGPGGLSATATVTSTAAPAPFDPTAATLVGIDLTTSGQAVTFAISTVYTNLMQTLGATQSSVLDNGDGTYTLLISNSLLPSSGAYQIAIFAGGTRIRTLPVMPTPSGATGLPVFPAASISLMPVLNNADTTLSTAHAVGDGTLVVANGAVLGTTFPLRVSAVMGLVNPIFLVTGRVGNTLTVGGMLEGTADVALPAGTHVGNFITGGNFSDIHTAITNVAAAAGIPVS